jgi:HPt (histidine-containing phosphotransfer) domain-containing protein
MAISFFMAPGRQPSTPTMGALALKAVPGAAIVADMPSRNPGRVPQDDAPLVDWSRLEEIRACDPRGGALVRKVVGTFVREGGTRIAAIERAAGGRDAAALAAAAHALKGAALNVGAAALAQLCAGLEARGREGRMDGAAASAALLQQRFSETAQALEKELPAQARREDRAPVPRRTVDREPGGNRRKR